MKKYKMFIIYYIIGIIGSLALTAYPLIFSDKGYDAKHISLFISLGFIMAIFKPFIGYFTDRFYTNLKMTKLSFIAIGICTLLMFFSPKLFIPALIISSIFRSGMAAFLDSYIIKHPNQFELSYAEIRIGMPIGMASAFFAGEIFIEIFNLSISGMLLFMTMVCLISFILLLFTEDAEIKETKHKEIKTYSDDTYDIQGIITLIIYAFLYSGLFQISLSYLSIFFKEFGYSTFIIGIVNLVMLIPQLFLIFNYNKILGKLRNSTILIMSAAMGVVQAMIYVLFPHNLILLIFGSILGGIQLVIFPSNFCSNLSKAFKASRVSTGLTLNTTIQALWVGLFNTLVVSGLYTKFETTIIVYIVIAVIVLISIIPMILYRRKHIDK